MSNNWNVFQTPFHDGLGQHKSLSEYYEVAEANRHMHFAEGLAELEHRAAGNVVNPELDPQTVFASRVERFAQQLRASEAVGEDAYLLLKQYTHLVWCCCFAGRAACDDIADLLEADLGWKARAEFIIALSDIREALGPEHFDDTSDLVRDPEGAAQARLQDRWRTEALAVSFGSEGYGSRTAQEAWISQLGADCLHDFVLNFDAATEPAHTLKAAAQNPACDRATAVALYFRCLEICTTVKRRGRNKAVANVLDCLQKRLVSGNFATSRLKPGKGVSAVDAQGEAAAQRLPAEVFDGFGEEWHQPTYAYDGTRRCFLTPFSTWSAIRIVASN